MLGIRTEEDKKRKVPDMHFPKSEKKKPILNANRTHTLPSVISTDRPKAKERFVKSARYSVPEQIVDPLAFDIHYLPLETFDGRVANGFVMPYPILDSEWDRVESQVRQAVDAGAKHILVTHISQISRLTETGCVLHGDFRLNITNSASAAIYSQLEDVILSPELTLPQIRDMHFAKSTIIYGRLPLMTLEKRVEHSSLVDRRGVRFPVVSSSSRDLVLNSVPVYMLDKKTEMKKAGGGVHFIFTTETPEEVKGIIGAYCEGTAPMDDVKRISS